MKRILSFLSLALLLILIAVAAVVYVRFLYSPSMTTNQVAEITPDWNALSDGAWGPWVTDPNGDRVWDPALSYNTWVGTIPNEQKAWGLLADVEHRPDALAEEPLIEDPPKTEEEWNALSDLLRKPASQDQLSMIREAFTRDFIGSLLLETTDPIEHEALVRYNKPDQNWDPNPDLASTLLRVRYASLGPIRKAIRVLDLSSAVELRDGDPDRFVGDIGLMLRASELAVEYPVLISELVRTAILAVVHDRVVWALSEHPGAFSDEQLRAIDSEIDRYRFGAFDMLGEQLSLHDTFRRVANKDGGLAASPAILTQGLNAYGSLDDPSNLEDPELDDSLQRPLWIAGKLCDRVRVLSALPWNGETELLSSEISSELDRANFAGKFLMDQLLPSFQNIPRYSLRIQQSEIGARTAIAIERHRLRHGSLPGSLDEIDEDLRAIEPLDVIANAPLRYRVEGDSFVLYSVGDDRDDDGGSQRSESNSYGDVRFIQPRFISTKDADQINATDPESIEGDWILYPKPQDPSE